MGQDNAAVAKSAGLAFLGRLGALIEVISLPLFTYFYGTATLGLFFALWGALRITTAFAEFAMTTTLQRFIPKAKSKEEEHSILKTAIITGLSLSLIAATMISSAAPFFAQFINANETDSQHLVDVIRFYVWILPFWTLVEILTSSVRAQRKFGPEIRVRIFYEQGLRLVGGTLFFYLGFQTFGLFFAHIFSVVIACGLAARLASRFYNLKDLFFSPFNLTIAREMWSFAGLMMPANMIKRLTQELPVILLNYLFPGAQGAEAAGIYGIGRKIASLLQVVRQSFEYVIAPFASLRHSNKENNTLNEAFCFSTRLTAVFLIPMTGFLLLIRDDLLSLFKNDVMAASGVILILSLGRLGEGITGPSNALIEMIGRRWLPVLNGLLGLTALSFIHLTYSPTLGPLGAAMAAAVGLNMVSLLSLIEAKAIYGYFPYKKSMIMPVFIAFLGVAIIIGLYQAADNYIPSLTFWAAGLGLFLAFVLEARYGLNQKDLVALGRPAQWMAGKRFKKVE
jgi:O-antigen/teichoic acid export membrane protein